MALAGDPAPVAAATGLALLSDAGSAIDAPLVKPDLPKKPLKPDVRRNDPDLVQRRQEEYDARLVAYNAAMKHYNEVLFPAYRKEQKRRQGEAPSVKAKRQRAQLEKQEREEAVAPELVQVVRDMWKHVGWMSLDKVRTEFSMHRNEKEPNKWVAALPEAMRPRSGWQGWQKLEDEAVLAMQIVRRERQQAGLPCVRSNAARRRGDTGYS